MIYDTIKSIKSNFKDASCIYDQNAYQNNTYIKSCTSMTSASITNILMLIREVICIIYLYYTVTNHLSIEQKTLMYLFTAIIIQVDCFMDIYIFYLHQSTCTSIITIFNELLNMFINFIVIGFNSVGDKLYHLSLIYPIKIHLSITSSRNDNLLIVLEMITQHFNNLNDNFDANKHCFNYIFNQIV